MDIRGIQKSRVNLYEYREKSYDSILIYKDT